MQVLPQETEAAVAVHVATAVGVRRRQHDVAAGITVTVAVAVTAIATTSSSSSVWHGKVASERRRKVTDGNLHALRGERQHDIRAADAEALQPTA
jgi:hypothetical protein